MSRLRAVCMLFIPFSLFGCSSPSRTGVNDAAKYAGYELGSTPSAIRQVDRHNRFWNTCSAVGTAACWLPAAMFQGWYDQEVARTDQTLRRDRLTPPPSHE